MNLCDKSLNSLQNDGFLIIEEALDLSSINLIKRQIEKYNKVTFNDQIGSFIISENLWIDNFGLCSPEALKIALDSKLLKFLDAYFGEMTVLGSFKYQKKIKTHKDLPAHSDKGPGLVMFIFLNEINEETGATRFIKGTHLHKLGEELLPQRHQDTDYVKEELYDFNNESIRVSGGPGTILIFNQRVIHDLPKFTKPGRETIWATYYSISDMSLCENQIYNRNTLTTLSKDQLSRILFPGNASGTPLTKLGEQQSVADTYNINIQKRIFYIFRYFIINILKKF